MQRVPRYTSYPTAPHFHEGVTAMDYLKWLNTLSDQDNLSLYFHIPYCRQLCWFCGCHTKVVNQYEPITRYLDILRKEVALISTHTTQSLVQHVHFGGGSPTILSATDFTEFMTLLRDQFSFAPDAQIDIEIDPRTVDGEKITAYAKGGVTRASIGVQDFNPKVQKAINRTQPYDLVQGVINTLRTHHINALNVDLIYGLPYQDEQTIADTIEQTLTLEPDRISLFGYAHVPWMKKHQQLVPEAALPSQEVRGNMFEQASVQLLKAGYVAVGLDHFAKPDDPLAIAAQQKRLRRNFQGYTTDTASALIGMGVSSISSLPQGYIQNTSSNIDYAHKLKVGKLPVLKGLALTEDDISRRNIIMSLMCNLSAHIPHGRYKNELHELEKYKKSGDITLEGDRLKINPDSRHLLRLIAAVFDSYLAKSSHRYSQAI